MTVFRMRSDIENYRSLTFRELVEGVPFDVSSTDELFYDACSIEATWKPRRVVYWNEDVPEGDFPSFEPMLVFTRQALDALRDLLDPNGEFLPLESHVREFHAYKVLRFVDGLDLEQSVIDWWPQLKKDAGKPRVVRDVKRFVFHDSAIADATIFKVPQMSMSHVFVTDSFVQRVNDARLTGFLFHQLWPPPDPSLERQRFLDKRKRRGRRRGG